MLQRYLPWYSLPLCIPLRSAASRMENGVERRPDCVDLPVIATLAHLLRRELMLQNEYLRLENRILKEKVSGRIRFTDEERRSLTEAALAMGRSLMKEGARIIKPETILAWQRRLERKKKWDYSERRQHGTGRPRTPEHIAALVRRLARENPWVYWRLRGELLELRVLLSTGLHCGHPEPERTASCSAPGSLGSGASPAMRRYQCVSTSSPRRCGPSPGSGRPTCWSCCTWAPVGCYWRKPPSPRTGSGCARWHATY